MIFKTMKDKLIITVMLGVFLIIIPVAFYTWDNREKEEGQVYVCPEVYFGSAKYLESRGCVKKETQGEIINIDALLDKR